MHWIKLGERKTSKMTGKTILLLYFSVIIACIIYNIIIDSERNISEVDYNLPCSLFSNSHFKREWIRTTIKKSEVC